MANENANTGVDPVGNGVVPAPPKRGVGRPRKDPSPVPAVGDPATPGPPAAPGPAPIAATSTAVEAVQPATSFMTAAARAESARVHRIEREQRELRAEVLQHEKALVEATTKRKGSRTAETILVVERPVRAGRAALHPDGTPVIREPTGKRGEMRMTEELGRRRNLDEECMVADEALLKRLQGPRGKAVDVPPLTTRGAKRKAEESIATKAAK